MYKTSTSRKPGLSFWGLMFMLLFFSCSPRVEQEKEGQHNKAQAASEETAEIVVLATAQEPVQEAYFDLIANTSACLGEDLWIGGKVESTNKVALSKAGAITNQKVYEVKDLTATGLNTNSYYSLRDSAGTLKVLYDEEGVLHIQIQEGPLKLVPRAGHGSILVAYQASQDGNQSGDDDGSWRCQ